MISDGGYGAEPEMPRLDAEGCRRCGSEREGAQSTATSRCNHVISVWSLKVDSIFVLGLPRCATNGISRGIRVTQSGMREGGVRGEGQYHTALS